MRNNLSKGEINFVEFKSVRSGINFIVSLQLISPMQKNKK